MKDRGRGSGGVGPWADVSAVALTRMGMVPEGLENFMSGCPYGAAAARRAFLDAALGAGDSPEAVCGALNSHPWAADRFGPGAADSGGFTVMATGGECRHLVRFSFARGGRGNVRRP